SGNSLFAVPANQEFVYVRTTSSIREDTVDFFLQKLRTFCSPDYYESLSGLWTQHCLIVCRRIIAVDVAEQMSISPSKSTELAQSETPSHEHTFSSFLWQHIELALSKGFDDNVGRHPIPADFELPTVSVWFKVAAKLRDLILFNDSKSSVASSLKAALDVDIRFSEGRCGKVLPVASASYQENLPSHYTADYHQRKVCGLLTLFFM
ncbi:unnamed protein product, partial [Ixodes pacificus]